MHVNYEGTPGLENYRSYLLEERLERELCADVYWCVSRGRCSVCRTDIRTEWARENLCLCRGVRDRAGVIACARGKAFAPCENI